MDASKYAASSSSRKTTLTHAERCRIAFLSTPFPDRLLCVNAFFSRLWNKAASARVELSSSSVLVGDLVYDKDTDNGVRAAHTRRTASRHRACQPTQPRDSPRCIRCSSARDMLAFLRSPSPAA